MMTRSLDLLDRLVAFPTVSSQSNLDLIEWAETLLRKAGFTVTRIPSPNGEKAGLHARIGPHAPGGICLSGHTDVVPVEGQAWTRDAFRLSRDGERVHGRGTTDMKGFVASALALAERAATVPLEKPLSLVLSYDEEVGCLGVRDMLPALRPLLGQPELVIVGEPTSMEVAVGHKGKAALRATCTGEPGHSALAPNFVNAIHVAASFIAELQSLQDSLSKGPNDAAYDIPFTTVHIGKIAGGRALNIVPDLTTIDFEYRHLMETPAQELWETIEAAARRVEAAFDGKSTIRIEEIFSYPGLNQDVAAPPVGLARELAGGTGTTKVAFGTEAGYFASLGLDTLVIGPGDMASDGHKPDEGLALAELAACDSMMDRVLERL